MKLARNTHEMLRAWGEVLDKEQAQGLGERLLCYADDWRSEDAALRERIAALEVQTERAAAVAHAECVECQRCGFENWVQEGESPGETTAQGDKS